METPLYQKQQKHVAMAASSKLHNKLKPPAMSMMTTKGLNTAQAAALQAMQFDFQASADRFASCDCSSSILTVLYIYSKVDMTSDSMWQVAGSQSAARLDNIAAHLECGLVLGPLRDGANVIAGQQVDVREACSLQALQVCHASRAAHCKGSVLAPQLAWNCFITDAAIRQ